MLRAVRDFVAEKRVTNVVEIARHVDAPATAVAPMVEHWVRKGCIQKRPKPAGCGKTCVKCDPALAQVVQWIGD